MKIAALVTRILLGLMFFVFGLNDFLQFIHVPMPTGVAGAFLGAMFQSHYLFLVGGTEVVAGALLLIGMYVPFALALLAPVLANILMFHLTMEHQGGSIAIVVSLLWIFLAWGYRASFAPMLTRSAAWN